jgi:hypothetical protein
MKVIVLPRTAWFGIIAIDLSLIVTLTVKIAGTLVVPHAEPATKRAAIVAQSARASVFAFIEGHRTSDFADVCLRNSRSA